MPYIMFEQKETPTTVKTKSNLTYYNNSTVVLYYDLLRATLLSYPTRDEKKLQICFVDQCRLK